MECVCDQKNDLMVGFKNWVMKPFDFSNVYIYGVANIRLNVVLILKLNLFEWYNFITKYRMWLLL